MKLVNRIINDNKLSNNEKKRLLQMFRKKVRHFKGNEYLIQDVAEHSETGELYVVYKALYGDCKTYIRPAIMFLSEVDREKHKNVEQKYRFELSKE